MDKRSFEFKVYAVGSNEVLTMEITQALLLIFESRLPINPCFEEDIPTHLDGDLYICNKLEEENLLHYVPKEKIKILNLTPVSRFYMKLASIPPKSDVYVFNNRMVYIKNLIDTCKGMELTGLNYIPVPYSEMPEAEVMLALQKARYIAGVDILLRDVLQKPPYNDFLKDDVVLIGAKRVASVNCTMDIIVETNRLLRQETVAHLEFLSNGFRLAASDQVLHHSFRELSEFLSLGHTLLSSNTLQEKGAADSVFKSALNQLNP